MQWLHSCANADLFIVETDCLYDVGMLVVLCLRSDVLEWDSFNISFAKRSPVRFELMVTLIGLGLLRTSWIISYFVQETFLISLLNF